MTRSRQAAAVLLLATLPSCWPGQPGAAEAHGLVLENHGGPGGLRVTNAGAAAVSIGRAIGVGSRDGDDWHEAHTEFNAVASCRPPSAGTGAVRLGAGQVLDVVPWRGATCAGQCNMSCRANIDHQPGTYRFVVTVLPRRERAAGPGFHFPGVR